MLHRGGGLPHQPRRSRRSSVHLFALEGDGDECDTGSDCALTFVDPARNPRGVVWPGNFHNPLCGPG